MTGCTDLRYFRKDCVHITVRHKFFYILVMAAGQALQPQFLTASAVVGHLAQLQGLLIGFLIHISHHQNFLCPVILYDNGYHAVTVLFEIFPLVGSLEGFNGNIVLPAQILQGYDLFHIVIYRIAGDTTDILISKNLQQFIQCHLIDLHEKRKGKNGLSLPDLMRVHQDHGRDIFLNLLLM